MNSINLDGEAGLMFTIARLTVGDGGWEFIRLRAIATSFSVSVMPVDSPTTVVDMLSLGLFQVADKVYLDLIGYGDDVTAHVDAESVPRPREVYQRLIEDWLIVLIVC